MQKVCESWKLQVDIFVSCLFKNMHFEIVLHCQFELCYVSIAIRHLRHVYMVEQNKLPLKKDLTLVASGKSTKMINGLTKVTESK